MQDLPYPLTLERRVEFSQTDAAGIAHFSTFFTFMEAAEAELFRRLGFPLLWEENGRGFGFPRVNCQCKFRRPVRFDEPVKIELSIEDLDSRRIHFTFVFRDPSAQRCAYGSMITACAMTGAEGSISGTTIPAGLKIALEAWKNQHP